ncbi:MAG: glycosyltransferase family 39 protein, partial [Thermoflexales bacterium]
MSSVTRATRPLGALAILVIPALAVRMIGLAAVPPRWDEGWSIAHASLPIGELLRITAADVHPPLYYLALGAWQAVVGQNVFALRFLGVLASLLSVPLTYVVAIAWTGRRGGLAVLAAAAMAWLPLAVYYSAVARMYAFAPSFLLLATWAVLQRSRRPAGMLRARLAFGVGAVGAMLTLYHAVWPLAALSVYAFARASGPQRLRLFIWTASAAGLYLPWALFALPQLLGRAASEGATNIGQQFTVGYFVENGLIGLTMSQWVGWLGVAAHAVLFGLGILLAPRRRALWLPILAIMATLIGVAAAARNWAFNARMLIGAAPFLVLGLAWAVDALARRAQVVAAIAVVALLALYAPTSAILVPAKSLEVFDPYNPHTYAEHLATQGRSTDLAIFNVLSPAGFYALDRAPSMPAWSYALTWDPVIEPRALWEARITNSAKTHDRLWLVLYRGLAGKNGDLRGWMDSTFYPADSEWGEEEVFYGLYGVAR